MFKHNWAWIKLATYNSSTVLTRNLRNPRDYAPLNAHSVKNNNNMDHSRYDLKLFFSKPTKFSLKTHKKCRKAPVNSRHYHNYIKSLRMLHQGYLFASLGNISPLNNYIISRWVS